MIHKFTYSLNFGKNFLRQKNPFSLDLFTTQSQEFLAITVARCGALLSNSSECLTEQIVDVEIERDEAVRELLQLTIMVRESL